MSSYKDLLTEALENLGSKVKEVADSDAVRSLGSKVREVTESERVRGLYEQGAERVKNVAKAARLTLDSSRDSAELKKVYAEIGKLYFEENRSAPELLYAGLFSQAEELLAELTEADAFFSVILDYPDAAEAYDAAHLEPPLAGLFPGCVDDRETRFVAFPDGIQFVPLFCTVEIEFTLLIRKVDRNGIGVSAIADYGKESTIRITQNGNALLIRQLLFETAHRPERRSVAHTKRDD